MVGLVLVSHSQPLALALKDMVDRLYGGKVPVAVAAGADEGRELGTDATAIMAAVEGLDTPEGVLVLLDLGSALLSAELALDLLGEPMRARVTLCPAPLVEGAIAAAAQISIGAPLADVRAEAESALRQKQEQLAAPHPDDPPTAAPTAAPTDAAATSVELRVENPHGLHARPAMRIVQTAARFPCAVQIANLRTDSPPASARSLVAINCLDARRGDTIRITARGDEAPAAIAALSALHAEHFGDALDEPPAPTPPATPPPTAPLNSGATLRGQPLSDGIVVGRIVFADHAVPDLPLPAAPVDPAVETGRLRDALAAVSRRLGHEAALLAARLGRDHAAILEAHRLLAEDPALAGRAEILITDRGLPAAHAWRQAAEAVAATYRAMPDPLWRERARDVEDLGLQVLRELGFGAPLRVDLSVGASLLAVPTLLPSEIATLDWRRLRGVIAESIGQTSHAAILLRAAGVAVVDGVATDSLRQSAPAGGEVALDGSTGEVWLAPDDRTCALLEERRAAQRARPAAGRPAAAGRPDPGRPPDRTGGQRRRHRRRRGGPPARSRGHRPAALGIPVPRPAGTTGGAGATGNPARDRGPLPAGLSDHGPHARHRRGQARALPAGRAGGQPVPGCTRPAPDPGARGPVPDPTTRHSAGGARKTFPGHVPDGDRSRRTARRPPPVDPGARTTGVRWTGPRLARGRPA